MCAEVLTSKEDGLNRQSREADREDMMQSTIVARDAGTGVCADTEIIHIRGRVRELRVEQEANAAVIVDRVEFHPLEGHPRLLHMSAGFERH